MSLGPLVAHLMSKCHSLHEQFLVLIPSTPPPQHSQNRLAQRIKTPEQKQPPQFTWSHVGTLSSAGRGAQKPHGLLLLFPGAIRKQLAAFLEGFYEIIPKRLISIFTEQELELLISGLPTIDIDDLKSNTEYHKYQSNSIQVSCRCLERETQTV